MKRSMQIITAGIVGTLLLGAMAGCSSSQSSTSSSSNKSSSSKGGQEDINEAPMSIKWLSFYGPENNDTYPQRYLEERFDIEIENMIIDRNSWAEQLNVRLAGGDIPDIFWTWGVNEMQNYAKQGVLAEIPQDKIREKMPLYAQAVDEMDPLLWGTTIYEGKNYGVRLYWEEGRYQPLPVYNKEWLDAVGADVPETLEEFVDVLTKFTYDDPNGSGRQDTYGMGFRGRDHSAATMQVIYSAYGLEPMGGWVLDDDGETVVQGFMTEDWRKATALIQQLYADGIIDPESVTDDHTQLTQKFSHGITGVQGHGRWYHWLPETGSYGSAATNAGVEFVTGPIPYTADSVRPNSNYMSIGNSPIALGVQLEDDEAKMDKCLEILEALHSDEEAYIATVLGEEGVTYDMVDGSPILRNELVGDSVARGADYGIGSYYGMFGGSKSIYFSKYDYPAEDIEFRDEFRAYSNSEPELFSGTVYAYRDYPDQEKIIEEGLIKMIMGELDTEGDLDDLRQRWWDNGGAEITAEANEIYAAERNK